MDSPEVHAPHKAHTGHRWLDIGLGVSALLVSAISLYVAVHHGQTMEKLVEANSFPNIEVGTEIADDKDPTKVVLKITTENNGVGPARVETMEIWDGVRPIETIPALVDAVKSRGGGGKLEADVGGGQPVGSLIGAGKNKDLIAIRTDRKLWYSPVVQFATAFQSRVCYCSVFDECFVSDSRVERGRPRHVGVCPKPAHEYQDDLAGFIATKVAGSNSPTGPKAQARPPT